MKSMQGTPLVIVTDLDGTLLDAKTYAWEPARQALERARSRGIPIVLASSKTRAEMEPIRFQLEHTEPFIVENGGAVFIPKGLFPFPLERAVVRGPYQVIEIGTPYVCLRTAIKEIAQEMAIRIKGFGDMSAEELAERTGLSRADAVLAKQREYDEPFLLDGQADLPELARRIEARGLTWTRGGRFHHLLGPTDKGRACREIIAYYRRQGGRQAADRPTVGIGDSLNDLPMLAAVDRAVLLQRPDGTYDPDVRLPHLIRAPARGPQAWNGAILDLLSGSSSTTG